VIQEDRLKKVCSDFSLLTEEQQEYILGILQALVFAKSVNSTGSQAESQAESSKTSVK
jgi:hypothetical protein